MSLDWKCLLCEQPKGQECVGTLTRLDGQTPEPLPNRAEHFARALPPDKNRSRTGKTRERIEQ
jgi:hypothetical protein